MFTGIVEAQSKIISVAQGRDVLRIQINKPSDFSNLKNGDSISVDGVCLTVESFSEVSILFSIAHETLKVTGWTESELLNSIVNLERPLQVNSRLHGHWVTGHVDTRLKVISAEQIGENKILKLDLPKAYKLFVVSKGSITLSGVALTINDVTSDFFTVCIIPETLSQTNLAHLTKGQLVNVEFDYLVKIINKSLINFVNQSKNSSAHEIIEQLRGLDE